MSEFIYHFVSNFLLTWKLGIKKNKEQIQLSIKNLYNNENNEG